MKPIGLCEKSMAWYSTGTVTVTTGSATVTGTGTSFINNARYGDALSGPDGKWYEIITIVSDTVLSIAPPYAGTSASLANFQIVPIQGYVKASADTLNQVTQDLVGRLDAIDNLDTIELSSLNGVTSNIQDQLDSKFTGNPTYLSDRANHTGVQAISTVTGLQTSLDGKQPLNAVLTATTASFTTAQETKLSGIATGATANQTDLYLIDRANHTGTQPLASIDGLVTDLAGKQPLTSVLTGTQESFTTVLKTKLDGITTGATVNAADADLRDRSTHTGSQATSTITGLDAALAAKQATLVSGTNIKTINGTSLLAGGDIVIDGDVVLNGIQILNGKSGETVNLVPSDIGAATEAQGDLADSAVQPADMSSAITTALSTYATDAELASAIATRATTAQGALADTALQPGAVETNTFVKRIRTLALAAI